MLRQITQCPVCDAPVQVTELSCTSCDTRLHGVFPAPPLARIPAEHQRFIETFVMCRGVIRDVERELGISYPTVRAKLDAAVSALESVLVPEPSSISSLPSVSSVPSVPSVPSMPNRDENRRHLLRAVEEGRISPAEAAEALRKL